MVSRRNLIKGLTAGMVLGEQHTSSSQPESFAQIIPSDLADQLQQKIDETAFIDTHEHLLEEEERIQGLGPNIPANDWSFLFSHFASSDLISSGMPFKQVQRFLSTEVDPLEKWLLIEDYWPRIRFTGYGRSIKLTLKHLYGIESLSKETVPALQEAYLTLIRPGYYKHVLQNVAHIESCQVNSITQPFCYSSQPTLLLQDLDITGMHNGPIFEDYAIQAGIEVHTLKDWHGVINWWFNTYAPYAIAVKSHAAYNRNLNYESIPPEVASPLFKKKRGGIPLTAHERKQLEDHLFWYCVHRATEWDLPVKLHTGYHAGQNAMPLERVQQNPADLSALCRRSPGTKFVFLHIAYPYHDAMIALAKQYTNAYLEMSWAWILNPIACVNFLKQFLVTAPLNKVLTFGGDYIPIEPVVGHAFMARKGIANVLLDLVNEGWFSHQEVFELIEPLMRGNAYKLFRIKDKLNVLKKTR